jgi:hypothetical protein
VVESLNRSHVIVVLCQLYKDFSFLNDVQLDSEAQLASYPIGTGDSFPQGKAAEA